MKSDVTEFFILLSEVLPKQKKMAFSDEISLILDHFSLKKAKKIEIFNALNTLLHHFSTRELRLMTPYIREVCHHYDISDPRPKSFALNSASKSAKKHHFLHDFLVKIPKKHRKMHENHVKTLCFYYKIPYIYDQDLTGKGFFGHNIDYIPPPSLPKREEVQWAFRKLFGLVPLYFRPELKQEISQICSDLNLDAEPYLRAKPSEPINTVMQFRTSGHLICDTRTEIAKLLGLSADTLTKYLYRDKEGYTKELIDPTTGLEDTAIVRTYKFKGDV